MLSNSTPKSTKTKISKANIILVIILIVLIIAAGIIIFISSMGNNSMPLSGLEQKVDTLEVTRLGEVHTMVKQDSLWLLASRDNQVAKQEYIADVFSTLDELVVTDIVSSNPEKQSIYQVDDSGTKVVMKSGDKVIESFVVGKNGPSWPSSYLRWQDDNNVYLVRDTLPQVFGWSEWRNMTILQIPELDIAELKWSNGLDIVKEDGAWRVVAPKELTIESSKIKSVLDNLSNLEAIDIGDMAVDQVQQGDANFYLEITSTDDTIDRLGFWKRIIEEGDHDYHVIHEGDDTVYVLTKYVAENMEKKIEFLED